MRYALGIGLALGAAGLFSLAGCRTLHRQALFFPTHHPGLNGLSRWHAGAKSIGCAREVHEPDAVWLFLHGNAGQAADRGYALPRFLPGDAVFILEYPGYGLRSGRPSVEAINAAARDGYRILRARYPGRPIGVVGESLGSGPACVLTQEPDPPDKLVLVNPYESIARVADDHSSLLSGRLIFAGTWDNREAVASYRGPVAIFSAEGDTLIPPRHGRALAGLLPQATFTIMPGGHNDWARQDAVKIRFP